MKIITPPTKRDPEKIAEEANKRLTAELSYRVVMAGCPYCGEHRIDPFIIRTDSTNQPKFNRNNIPEGQESDCVLRDDKQGLGSLLVFEKHDTHLWANGAPDSWCYSERKEPKTFFNLFRPKHRLGSYICTCHYCGMQWKTDEIPVITAEDVKKNENFGEFGLKDCQYYVNITRMQ